MNRCPGTIESMKGEVVLFTGRAVINGNHLKRRVLQEFARGLGAEVAADPSRQVTMLVVGETWTGPLHDERRRYSQKAAFIEEVQRVAGHHVHVLDTAGFAELLHGRPAVCHRLREAT